MLDVNQYRTVLISSGCVQTHQTQYAVEFQQESSGELVYINRKKASAALVVNPRNEHLLPSLCAISGIMFRPGENHYKHNSSFSRFPKRTNYKKPIGYGLEFVAESTRAAAELLRLIATDSGEPTILEEIEAVKTTLGAKGSTEYDSIIKARPGQGPWRAGLDEYWGGCALTNCDIREMLRGSHIKPWKESNDEEKLDVCNGLLLRADVDALFDKGLLTFLDDGAILLARHITESQRKSLPFDLTLKLRSVPEPSKKYLQYHRRVVFKGSA